mmetsp:Transcript_23077/g.71968  ORF Transcript_23077/g.71968 Transcript_23077/m.71968 type:complete len:213 (-) Transcript_23077:3-641(-)
MVTSSSSSSAAIQSPRLVVSWTSPVSPCKTGCLEDHGHRTRLRPKTRRTVAVTATDKPIKSSGIPPPEPPSANAGSTTDDAVPVVAAELLDALCTVRLHPVQLEDELVAFPTTKRPPSSPDDVDDVGGPVAVLLSGNAVVELPLSPRPARAGRRAAGGGPAAATTAVGPTANAHAASLIAPMRDGAPSVATAVATAMAGGPKALRGANPPPP